MLVRLLYASRAPSPLSASVVDSILEQSRKNNPPQGITGMLCFSDDIFLQVLEGSRDTVCELFNTIVRDSRHHGIRILPSHQGTHGPSSDDNHPKVSTNRWTGGTY